MQPGKPETLTEKATRIAKEAGACYPETIVALLEPYEHPTAAGMSLFAFVNGQTLPFEAAVAETRKDEVLGPLFQPGGVPDVRKVSQKQFLAIRKTAPQLWGLAPIKR